MSGWEDTWAKHYQIAWEEHAGNPRLPMWLRVTSLAYGKHRGNGHAPFRTGEVRLALSRVEDGVIHQPDSSDVTRAIRTAMDYGFLATGSGARCLVVPGNAISGGRGSAYAPCPEHQKRTTKAA